MYRITNTSNDRQKEHLHRTASQFENEPSIGGIRIRLGQYMDIAEDHYNRIKEMIDLWVAKGMVSVSVINMPGNKAQEDTVEEIVAVEEPVGEIVISEDTAPEPSDKLEVNTAARKPGRKKLI